MTFDGDNDNEDTDDDDEDDDDEDDELEDECLLEDCLYRLFFINSELFEFTFGFSLTFLIVNESSSSTSKILPSSLSQSLEIISVDIFKLQVL